MLEKFLGRLVGDAISIFRPVVRKSLAEPGAQWLNRILPAGSKWGGRIRSDPAEGLFGLLTTEIERWGEKKGDVLGELIGVIIGDAGDLFDEAFWRKQNNKNNNGVDSATVRKVQEIRTFWTEARRKIFEAEDPQAEGEQQLQRWEVLKSILDRVDQEEEVARIAAGLSPAEEHEKDREPSDLGKKAKGKAYRADVRVDRALRGVERRLENWLDERGA